jgi:hypothetical protein
MLLTRTAIALGHAVVVEQPASSVMHLHPRFQNLIADGQGELFYLMPSPLRILYNANMYETKKHAWWPHAQRTFRRSTASIAHCPS